jgi:hypothetical protein
MVHWRSSLSVTSRGWFIWPKTPGDKFPARSRNTPRSLIDVASGSLPKPPVSLSPGDEVPPHVYSKAASTARKICDQRCKKTFTTQSANKRHHADTFDQLGRGRTPAISRGTTDYGTWEGGRIARSAVMAAGHFPLRTSRHDRFAAASGRHSVVIACRRGASACNESR